ncbi:MAG TPA: pantoate--beta-alanine ligase [Anaerolineae bacterium]|nr:pantoate--beta-alanine ligase [Anaerolineae bacterium]HID84994.1 pantoate--beta-alanine ligase [Anaerolineales bacterium]HIQ09593.1 pantoate--beta-alanine ligase [Anaerolineaceae bacterium]
MQVVTTLDELWAARARLPEPVGFVPTMGYLHEGHLSLVRYARKGCRSVAVSIFVNPTQFGPNEDLDKYPRDLERDLALLEAEGVDLVWTPTAEVMYPEGYQTWVTVEEITKPLEGGRRPGHFRGVTTVVAKLFNAVRPQWAFFGQKDAQQARVIQQMTRDLSLPIGIVVCPIVREPDGLAMSSRNTYLGPRERQAATVLYRALRTARETFEAGEREAETLRRMMRETMEAEPLARLQYVSCADPETLAELHGPVKRALLSMAVFVGQTRLIDNMLLGLGRDTFPPYIPPGMTLPAGLAEFA